MLRANAVNRGIPIRGVELPGLKLSELGRVAPNGNTRSCPVFPSRKILSSHPGASSRSTPF